MPLLIITINLNISMVQDAKSFIREMVQAVGGKQQFHATEDVQYEYVYRDLQSGKKDVSIERYVFDGELSWAKYLVRENSVFPELDGEMIQGYDGKQSRATLDGQLIRDEKYSGSIQIN